MAYKQLSQEEFEHIARLMRETKAIFKEVDWEAVEIIGKGHIDSQDKPVCGEPTLKEKLLDRPASRIIGTEIGESYNMVFLLAPYVKDVPEEDYRVTLFAETTYSVNMHCAKRGDNVIRLDGRLYGPNHSPDMSYDFQPDTVVFPMMTANLAEILALQETKC